MKKKDMILEWWTEWIFNIQIRDWIENYMIRAFRVGEKILKIFLRAKIFPAHVS